MVAGPKSSLLCSNTCRMAESSTHAEAVFEVRDEWHLHVTLHHIQRQVPTCRSLKSWSRPPSSSSSCCSSSRSIVSDRSCAIAACSSCLESGDSRQGSEFISVGTCQCPYRLRLQLRDRRRSRS